MRHGNRRDRLVDVLLAELLGDERPPDLSRRILARAGAPWRRVLVGAGAAAAVVALAVGAWALFLAYPGPRGMGPLTVVGGGSVRRGATLVAGERPSTLRLGGYCKVELHPGSRVRVAGRRRAESVVLEQGGVTCEVDRGRGRFVVATSVGEVRVTGTQFTVRLLEGKGEDAMRGRQMLVSVVMGAVLVSGSWGQLALGEGEERRVPERRAARVEGAVPEGIQGFQGTLIGVLVSVGKKGCTLEVANVRPGEGNKARNPEGAIGERLPIHYVAHVGREGGYQPSEELRAQMARLRERGGLVTLKVRPDGAVLIANAAWAGAKLRPEGGDRPRAAREGEREGEGRREGRREGDREGEGRRERRREVDGEGEGRREERREVDGEGEGRRERRREGDREGEGRREERREGEREVDKRREERREGDKEGEGRREERREGEREVEKRREERRREGDGEGGERREERRRDGDREGEGKEGGDRERDGDREGGEREEDKAEL